MFTAIKRFLSQFVTVEYGWQVTNPRTVRVIREQYNDRVTMRVPQAPRRLTWLVLGMVVVPVILMTVAIVTVNLVMRGVWR